MRKKLLDELKRTFRPEFINRVDSVIVFRTLNRDEISQIVALELDKVRARLAEYDLTLQVTDAAQALLAEEGYSEEYGARPLRRAIQSRVEDVLSDAILESKFSPGDAILADAVEDELVFTQGKKVKPGEKEEEPATEAIPA